LDDRKSALLELTRSLRRTQKQSWQFLYSRQPSFMRNIEEYLAPNFSMFKLNGKQACFVSL
jgi:hypothetical protein